jgi:hypothetical protein
VLAYVGPDAEELLTLFRQIANRDLRPNGYQPIGEVKIESPPAGGN